MPLVAGIPRERGVVEKAEEGREQLREVKHLLRQCILELRPIQREREREELVAKI